MDGSQKLAQSGVVRLFSIARRSFAVDSIRTLLAPLPYSYSVAPTFVSEKNPMFFKKTIPIVSFPNDAEKRRLFTL